MKNHSYNLTILRSYDLTVLPSYSLTVLRSYGLYLKAFLLFFGLILLLSSCDREDIPGGSNREEPALPAGEPVMVNFRISEPGFGDNITARNASPNPSVGAGFARPLETVVIPVTEEIYMYATLTEEEAPVKLRSQLAINSKVRIVAYTPLDTVNLGYADYKVLNDFSLEPLSHPLFVTPEPSGTSYRFVAYSFHDSDPLAMYADTTAILYAPVDVLWGDITHKITNRRDTTVTIEMRHLSSQVTMQVSLDSVVVGTNINSVVGASVFSYDPRLIVRSGKLVLNAASPNLFYFSWASPGGGNPLAPSDPLNVFTNGFPLKVEIDSIWIDNAPYSGPYIIPFSTPLDVGKSYTLNVNFSLSDGCADILYLASDGTLSVGKWKDGQINMSNLLFFKFGSIVGFTAPNPPNPNTQWTNSLILFNPTTINITTYTANNGGIPGYTTNTDWSNGANRVLNVSGSNYHNAARLKQGKGDPCKLVGLKAADIRIMSDAALNNTINNVWRLPTAAENIDFVRAPSSFNTIIDNPSATNPSLSNSSATYWGSGPPSPAPNVNGGWFPVTGHRESTTGRTTRTINPHGFLPITGFFQQSGNGNNNPGYYNNIGSGAYWSSDVRTSGVGFRLLFDQSAVYPVNLGDYNDANPVRCVKSRIVF